MKQRFSYLDLRLIVNEWQESILNFRLENVYSLEASNRHFLFKFDGKIGKTFLIADPGYRIHLTKYQHPTTLQPSGFVAKLRKHLKSRRVSNLWVAARSRLLVITFNDGQYYLAFEFFSGGNILLLNENQEIIALMRTVTGSTDYSIGKKYEIDFDDKEASEVPDEETIKEWLGKDKIGKIVFSKFSSGSLSLVEHCLHTEGVDPKQKEGDPAAIKRALVKANVWAGALMAKPTNEGFILRKTDETPLEFEAFKEYFEDDKGKNSDLEIVSHETYNKTCDEYFGAIISDKQVSRTDQLQQVAENRLAAAKSESENRVKSLDKIQEVNELCGRLLEHNSDLVGAAINSVNQLLSQGTDWVDIENLIKLEKQRGNNVAKHIGKLDLAHDAITLDLPVPQYELADESDSDSENESSGKTMPVKVQLKKTPWANARDYFDIRRAAGAKKEKTVQHAEKAYVSAEKKIKRDLQVNLAKVANTNHALHSLREQYWFEKFLWFISSDGYLIIGGRDHLQNELLLGRYFDKNDVLVYCDVPKAPLVIIKNKTDKEVSPQALDQAGSFTLSSSQAWETKSPSPAWWTTRANVPRLNQQQEPTRLQDVALLAKRVTIVPSSYELGIGILWQTGSEETLLEAEDGDDDDSDEDFPDTRDDSDDDFPDTQLDSDDDVDDDDQDVDMDSIDEIDDTSREPSAVPSEEMRSVSPESISAEQTADVTDRVAEMTIDDAEETPEPQSRATSEQPSLEPTSQEDDDERDASDAPSEVPSTISNSGDKLKTQLRGKSKTAKKKLRKYADQDEEDRAAAMERIGTLKGLTRIEEEKRKREEERQQQLEWKRQREERARQAELRRIAGEIVEDTPIPTDLVVKPAPDSQLVSAVAVFGPWSSMKYMKYKVKVIPGNLKKGKVTDEALRMILNNKDEPATQKQKDLVAAVRSSDLQQSVSVSRMQLATAQKGKNSSSAKGAGNRGSKAAKGGSKGNKKKA